MQKRSSWQIQKAVFFALFVRELQTRFGKYRLGYLWALIEPLSHIIVLSVLFSFISREGVGGIPFPLFFGTGILTFFAFQSLVLTSINSITSNRGLLGYRQVKSSDTIITRSLLELTILIAVMFVLAFIGGWFLNYSVIPHDPLRALLVFLVMGVFGLGVGFLSAVIGALHEEWAKFITHIIRPLYFISGVMFPIQAIPEQYHHYLLWNPLLHGLEEFRSAYFQDYPQVDTSLSYVAIWALLALFCGLWYHRYKRLAVIVA